MIWVDAKPVIATMSGLVDRRRCRPVDKFTHYAARTSNFLPEPNRSVSPQIARMRPQNAIIALVAMMLRQEGQVRQFLTHCPIPPLMVRSQFPAGSRDQNRSRCTRRSSPWRFAVSRLHDHRTNTRHRQPPGPNSRRAMACSSRMASPGPISGCRSNAPPSQPKCDDDTHEDYDRHAPH